MTGFEAGGAALMREAWTVSIETLAGPGTPAHRTIIRMVDGS